LLVLERASGGVTHRHFPELLELIAPQDVLVLNVSRVIPARLLARARRDSRPSCCWCAKPPTARGWRWRIRRQAQTGATRAVRSRQRC